jgi:hypothetical protein
MFDNVWGYYHTNSTSKRSNICLSYECHTYIVQREKRNTVQSLNYYYYYYYFGYSVWALKLQRLVNIPACSEATFWDVWTMLAYLAICEQIICLNWPDVYLYRISFSHICSRYSLAWCAVWWVGLCMAVVTECIAFFIGKQRDISASIYCGRNAHVLHINLLAPEFSFKF